MLFQSNIIRSHPERAHTVSRLPPFSRLGNTPCLPHRSSPRPSPDPHCSLPSWPGKPCSHLKDCFNDYLCGSLTITMSLFFLLNFILVSDSYLKHSIAPFPCLPSGRISVHYFGSTGVVPRKRGPKHAHDGAPRNARDWTHQ